MIATSPTAASTFGYDTGTAAAVTVPAGCVVVSLSCTVAAGGSAGSLTIVQGGPGKSTSPPGSGGAIPIPAGTFFCRDWPLSGPLQGGSVLTFAGTASYYVEYAKGMVGG